MFACLFSLSLSWWFFFHSLLSLWVVAGRSPGAFATPWAQLGELMLCDHSTEQFDPLFSVCCGGHSLWSLFFGSCIIPFFHTVSTTKDFVWLSKLIMNPFTHWLIVVCSLVAWKRNIAPIQQCGSALLISCCKWIWRVTMWLRLSLVQDRTGSNCGREAWAEECAERGSGTAQIIHACFICIQIANC